MESQHRFPQSLENARAFSHISTARLRLHSLSKKGIIVDREREKCLTLINLGEYRKAKWTARRHQYGARPGRAWGGVATRRCRAGTCGPSIPVRHHSRQKLRPTRHTEFIPRPYANMACFAGHARKPASLASPYWMMSNHLSVPRGLFCVWVASRNALTNCRTDMS